MEYENAVKQTSVQLMTLLFALASGAVLFGVVGAAMGPFMEPEAAEQADFLRWIVVALPLIELPMAAQLWMMMGKRMEATDDWRERVRVLRARTIVVAAMFEAPALLAGTVLLLLGPSWHVIPAFALFIAAMGGLLPTPSRVQRAIGREDGKAHDEYS